MLRLALCPNPVRRSVAAIIPLIAVSCAAPYNPDIASEENVKSTYFLKDCYNIDKDPSPNIYKDDNYLSTWMVVGDLDDSKAFCRAYNASWDKVVLATDQAFKKLPHAIKNKDLREGYFETELKKSFHRAADWEDGYSAAVHDLGSEVSAVYIYRDLFVSWNHYDFHQQVSVGHNEAWLLGQIASYLKDLPPDQAKSRQIAWPGFSSTDIAVIQQVLTEAGYDPGPADGAPGRKTTMALNAFQRDNNLAVGLPNKETLQALGLEWEETQ